MDASGAWRAATHNAAQSAVVTVHAAGTPVGFRDRAQGLGFRVWVPVGFGLILLFLSLQNPTVSGVHRTC